MGRRMGCVERRQGGQAAVSQRRRPELRRPGLKQQTPVEKRITDLRTLSDRKRWEYLFSLNVWRPSPR